MKSSLERHTDMCTANSGSRQRETVAVQSKGCGNTEGDMIDFF